LDLGRGERPTSSGWQPDGKCLCTLLGHNCCTNIAMLVREARAAVVGQSPGHLGVVSGATAGATYKYHAQIVDRWADERFGRRSPAYDQLRAHIVGLARSGWLAVPTKEMAKLVRMAAAEGPVEASAVEVLSEQLE
jgi:hypothetical protein